MSLINNFLKLLAPNCSWCGRCGVPWKFTETHSTPYTRGKGCFPLCEKCWTKLETPEKRIPYYIELMDEWDADKKTRADVYNAVYEGK